LAWPRTKVSPVRKSALCRPSSWRFRLVGFRRSPARFARDARGGVNRRYCGQAHVPDGQIGSPGVDLRTQSATQSPLRPDPIRGSIRPSWDSSHTAPPIEPRTRLRHPSHAKDSAGKLSRRPSRELSKRIRHSRGVSPQNEETRQELSHRRVFTSPSCPARDRTRTLLIQRGAAKGPRPGKMSP
jgi:hypothetical protein